MHFQGDIGYLQLSQIPIRRERGDEIHCVRIAGDDTTRVLFWISEGVRVSAL